MLVLRFAAIVLAVAAIIFVAVDAQDSGQTFVDPQNSARAEVGVAPLAWDDTVVRRPGVQQLGRREAVLQLQRQLVQRHRRVLQAVHPAQSSPQDLISLQNALRAGLGVGMLSWDSTLAAYAEAYAEKRKTDCQKIPSDGPYGENIFQGPQAPVPRMRSSPGSERSRTTTARPTNARVGKPAASTPSSSGQIRRESAVRLCERNL
ncbi:hypothetical protein HU200_011100 [Digitaria exilis]|uniref:SCP domain-containing protein n=1 Tax=Digitaria exilis TaxID=1010633 RepID=A0A835FGE0_9POAL|nr:hypothetical protein HU200_011100 [Digitaria exilis]